ncbi:Mph(A) family macrolide 2'-phosphotransferase, partial [Acinetobacter baumannii]|nr:Mph(A) family macrolide 2'-phosphotransferase [Acinetobacter baumannii]
PRRAPAVAERLSFWAVTYALFALDSGNGACVTAATSQLAAAQ